MGFLSFPDHRAEGGGGGGERKRGGIGKGGDVQANESSRGRRRMEVRRQIGYVMLRSGRGPRRWKTLRM